MGLNGQLPRRLQQCADHVARHLDTIALSTVAQVAQGAGVPPSAVMRFCQIMGFSGFAEMQRLFRRALSRAAPDYATRLANLKAAGRGQPAALVAEFVEAGRLSMEGLARDLDETTLESSRYAAVRRPGSSISRASAGPSRWRPTSPMSSTSWAFPPCCMTGWRPWPSVRPAAGRCASGDHLRALLRRNPCPGRAGPGQPGLPVVGADRSARPARSARACRYRS